MNDRIKVLQNLHEAFDEQLNDFVKCNYEFLETLENNCATQDLVTIGCEIEVPWRSYFPTLWEYVQSCGGFKKISKDELDRVSLICSKLEEKLHSDLKMSETCGVPKGKDKYYEFANLPACHPFTLGYEIHLLRHIGLIPDNNKHSLHITLGGIEANKESHLMLFALEILGYTSSKRINESARSDKAVGWGRKGRAGLRSRQSSELLLGANTGIELRTLELPSGVDTIYDIIVDTWQLANSMKKQDARWDLVREELHRIAGTYKIDIDTNWNSPYNNPEVWKDFSSKLRRIDSSHLRSIVDNYFI